MKVTFKKFIFIIIIIIIKNELRLINFPWICTHKFFYIFHFLHNFSSSSKQQKRKLFLAHKFFFISNLPTTWQLETFFLQIFFTPIKLHTHTLTEREKFSSIFFTRKRNANEREKRKKSTEFFFIFYFLWWFEKEKWLRRALEWQ